MSTEAELTKYIELLKGKQEQIDTLVDKSAQDVEFIEWKKSTLGVIERVWGADTDQYDDFKHIHYYSGIIRRSNRSNSGYEREQSESYKRGLEEARGVLRSLVVQLEDLGVPEKRPFAQRIGSQINFSPKISNTQDQSQSQEMGQGINVDFNDLIQKVRDKEPDEQRLKEVENLLKELEAELNNERPVWAKIKKPLVSVLNYGRDISVEVMAAVISRYMNSGS